MNVRLPPLPDRTLLADLCREAAARERIAPQLIEKDFYLTRLLWALGQTFGDALLLKGGTLLSKVDLGFSPEELDGRAELDAESPEAFGQEMALVHTQLGTRLLGGCCGADDRHLAAVASALAS